MDTPYDWVPIYKRYAREAEHMASVASNQGEPALANMLWEFEARMREKAKECARGESGS